MKKVFSVILSLVILITSMGFTVSSHMCGGKKVKTVLSIVNADVSCGMEDSKKECSTPVERMKSNCCQDEFQQMQLKEDYTQQVTEVDFSLDFLNVFVGVYFNLFETPVTIKDFFNDHSPPPLVRDIPVLVQSFLI